MAAVLILACGGQQPLRTVSDALSCAQTALGGAVALSAVSSLAVAYDIAPDPANPKGQPSTIELALGFPDRFKVTDSRLRSGRRTGAMWEGFSGDRQFVGTSDPDMRILWTPGETSLRRNRKSFAHWALLLLLRETGPTPLTWSQDLARDGPRVGMTATAAADFNMTVWLDSATCRPVAATYERAPNYGDAMGGRTAVNGRHVERFDLMDYRDVDGVLLPARFRTSTDGVPRSEFKMTSARVNPPPGELAIPPPRETGTREGR